MKVALTIIGAFAEFIALGLVVRDFYDARTQAEKVLRPVGTAPPELAPEDMTEEQRMADQRAQMLMVLTSPTHEVVLAGQRAGEVSEHELRAQFADALRGSGSRKVWS